MADILVNVVQDQTVTGGAGSLVMQGITPLGSRTVAQGVPNALSATYRFLDTVSGAWCHNSGCVWNLGTSTLTRGPCIDSSTGGPSAPVNIAFTAGVLVAVTLIQDASQIATTAGFKLTGAINWAAAIDVPASATPAIFAAASNNILLSGTGGPVGAFDTIADGAERNVLHTGAHTLTNGANLKLIGGVDIVCVAGDQSVFISEGAGVTRQKAFWPLGFTRALSADVLSATGSALKYATPKAIQDAGVPVAVAYASTIALDFRTGINFEIAALTGALLLLNPTAAGMKPGQSGAIGIPQDATGSRALTLGSQWKHVGGAPTLSTAPSSQDVLFYYIVSTTVIRCSLNKAFS